MTDLTEVRKRLRAHIRRWLEWEYPETFPFLSDVRGSDILVLLNATEWQPIESAPTDRLILVWCPPYEELPAHSLCQWHPDAGFYVDELRSPTHWKPLDPPTETKP